MDNLFQTDGFGYAMALAFAISATYASVSGMRSRAERGFAILSILLSWLLAAGFGWGFAATSLQYRVFLWIPYLLGFPLILHSIGKRRRQIVVRDRFFQDLIQGKKPGG